MKTAIYFIITLAMVTARPQFNQPQSQEAPQPYDFQYKVENPQTNTYFGQSEAADPAGRVLGTYYVLLADGRLMTIEYSVDGQSGFVPRISYQANANLRQG